MSTKRPTLKQVRAFKHRINPEEKQGAFGYYFVRPWSVYLTWLTLQTSVSANTVTVWQGIVGLLGAFAIGFGSTTGAIVGILLLQLGFVLDNVDGEVARFRNEVGVTGKYLDTIGHVVVVPFMYMGLGMFVFMQLDQVAALVFAFMAGFTSVRFDTSIMYLEAGQLIESKLDKAFGFYAEKKSDAKAASEDKPVNKKMARESLLFALFAYPATMNIISGLLLLDCFIGTFELFGFVLNFSFIYLILYGTILPIRRVITLKKLVKNNEIEKKYASLIEHIRK